MAKFSAALIASLVASASAFAPQQPAASQPSTLEATGFEEVGGVPFDPLNLAKLGTGESFDTFPNMFPDIQFLQEAEIKHGRQAMIAWTGIWATHQVREYNTALQYMWQRYIPLWSKRTVLSRWACDILSFGFIVKLQSVLWVTIIVL